LIRDCWGDVWAETCPEWLSEGRIENWPEYEKVMVGFWRLESLAVPIRLVIKDVVPWICLLISFYPWFLFFVPESKYCEKYVIWLGLLAPLLDLSFEIIWLFWLLTLANTWWKELNIACDWVPGSSETCEIWFEIIFSVRGWCKLKIALYIPLSLSGLSFKPEILLWRLMEFPFPKSKFLSLSAKVLFD